MFADPALGNLHLLDNASTRQSVIDKVAALAGVTTDIDRETRPAGAAADIGADEFAALGPVRVAGADPAYFLTISEAYSHTGTGGTIEAMEFLFTEDVTLDLPIPVILQGGYDSSFSEKSGLTTIHGLLTVQLGTLTVEDLEIR
jgi:hypothetical protein